ncbi:MULTISPECIES: SGNH/GDSL hydrolase family protein [Nocardia]|uniref:SGNH/GDSL hydrolase family protein n=1 Tax=Nocardia TaxID=1817 RepID=UPI000BEF8A02|nr:MULTISPECIES: SGNH/GDSL hydrolase family protein [Nocardia]MBF6183925.1 SGNH/GDSL hydrolase family protein [Nocardia farcinica]MBF6292868.1 SGNH/GDSL hydrolase family protein [Nocardia farcinica]MBF6309768.1 SGNH/GDSL hydrolase family protein [Nocardia farcinica]MBF6379163.1 SGNH/GDSL hydrolase family protein [Nocardia farcinica]MBF6383877.1 SGNH/GDSL hydrolase family protein [Nocardia farcinica]
MSTALIALGDSFVEGRGDTAPGGGYRGWVPRLGGQLGLRPAAVRNLGQHGATTTTVLDDQLPQAFSARAALYGVVVGVNDLVSDFHEARFERNLRTLFTSLRATGATVFTAGYPDIPARLPVPPGMCTLLRERFAFANTVLGAVTADTGTLLLDLASDPAWERPEMWTADGLHPAPLGHHLFAVTAADLIAAHTATIVAA